MNEIKFRGYSKKLNKWVFGDLCNYLDGKKNMIMPKAYFATRDFLDEDNNGNPILSDEMAIGGFITVEPESVGQYTGLKDKNGSEYFFNDIVKTKKGVGVLVWMDDKLGIASGEIGNYHAIDEISKNELEEYEVIGNIYENKNLLP